MTESICSSSENDKASSCQRPGIAMDDRMISLHSDPTSLGHIECPDRLKSIISECNGAGLLQRMTHLNFEMCPENILRLGHDAMYIKRIKNTTRLTKRSLKNFSKSFDSVYFCSSSVDSALLAVGAVVEATRSVVLKKCHNAIALVRPPGHHAMHDEANGFCIFNNVVVAAAYAKKHLNVGRVLIVDWDVHYGQGVQQAFYESADVLCVSVHRYENGNFWPYMREANFDCIGRNAGLGYNVNVPLNEIGLQDVDYLAIFHHIIMPIAVEFSPELILVSAGFDAAVGCPSGEMLLSPQVFGYFTEMLKGVSNGNLVIALEGGYCIPSLSMAVGYVIKSLLGDSLPILTNTGVAIRPSVLDIIVKLTAALKEHWTCMDYFNKVVESLGRSVLSYVEKNVPAIESVMCDDELAAGSASNPETLKHVLQLNKWRKETGFVKTRLAVIPHCPDDLFDKAVQQILNLQCCHHKFNIFSSRSELVGDQSNCSPVKQLEDAIQRLSVSSELRSAFVVHTTDKADWLSLPIFENCKTLRALHFSMAGDKLLIRETMQDGAPCLHIVLPLARLDCTEENGVLFEHPLSSLCGVADWFFLFHHLVLPLSYAFSPEVVFCQLSSPSWENSGELAQFALYAVYNLLPMASGKLIVADHLSKDEESGQLLTATSKTVVDILLRRRVLNTFSRENVKPDESTVTVLSRAIDTLAPAFPFIFGK